MRAIFILIVLFFQSTLVNANPYSFVGSYLDEQSYREFILDQQAVEQSCSLISSTYYNTYGEELYSCEMLSINGRKFILANGPHGELSKAELVWLKHKLNQQSKDLKLSFIMGEYLLRDNLVSKPSVIFEIQLLF